MVAFVTAMKDGEEWEVRHGNAPGPFLKNQVARDNQGNYIRAKRGFYLFRWLQNGWCQTTSIQDDGSQPLTFAPCSYTEGYFYPNGDPYWEMHA